LLIRALALAFSLLFVACTGDDAGAPDRATQPKGEYVAAYFVEGHGLMPEFRRLPAGDPVTGMLQMLIDGPNNGRRETFLPGDAAVLDTAEREADESLAIELNDAFWALPEGERFAAASQIVYTIATLEEGRTVFLLDGTVPGDIRDGNGDRVEQPLTRDSLGELEPWIQVSQPVAGAVVGKTIPVQASLRGPDATAVLVQEDDLLARGRLDGGRVLLEVGGGEPGPASLVIELTADGERHTTRLPLILSR
jgi:hypothetical protein